MEGKKYQKRSISGETWMTQDQLEILNTKMSYHYMASFLIKGYEILQNISHYSNLSHYSHSSFLLLTESHYASGVPEISAARSVKDTNSRCIRNLVFSSIGIFRRRTSRFSRKQILRMILVLDLVPSMNCKFQRRALATRTIVLTLLLGVNLARRSLQPSQGSHQLGCGGVSLTRSHVYNFGFRLSLSSYCKLASPSVENLFLPVFRNSYLPSNNKYLLHRYWKVNYILEKRW